MHLEKLKSFKILLNWVDWFFLIYQVNDVETIFFIHKRLHILPKEKIIFINIFIIHNLSMDRFRIFGG